MLRRLIEGIEPALRHLERGGNVLRLGGEDVLMHVVGNVVERREVNNAEYALLILPVILDWCVVRIENSVHLAIAFLPDHRLCRLDRTVMGTHHS